MRYCSQNLIERKDQTNPKEHCSIKKKNTCSLQNVSDMRDKDYGNVPDERKLKRQADKRNPRSPRDPGQERGRERASSGQLAEREREWQLR